MKNKFLTFLISCFIVFSGCLAGCTPVEYYVDYTTFNNVVAYNSDINFDNWHFMQKDGKILTPVDVTEDMIVSCDSTDSVGDKQLVIMYNETEITINFVVKYQIDYYVFDEVYETSYVLDATEIVLPQNPVVAGYEFVGWDTTITTIDSNKQVNAQFVVENTGIPALVKCNATFGDTLSSVQLPQNDKGKWEFVSPLTTTVGNVGENKFNVKFVPTNPELLPVEDEVTIKVKEKEVTFSNIVDTFMYDGTAKTPQYDLSVAEDIEVYCEISRDSDIVDNAVDAGIYNYIIEVYEPNYKGMVKGTMTINKVVATINIDDKVIDYTDAIPTSYNYEILDSENNELSEQYVTLLGASIVKPDYQHAGTYNITAQVTNPNFDVTINDGTLTVNKVELDISTSTPKFMGTDSVIYSNTLSSLVFEDTDVRGLWSWQNGEVVVDNVGEFEATVVFTPNNTQDYLPSTKTISIPVSKKVVTIVVTEDTYTYDTNPHELVYSVDGILEKDKNSVEVVGNISKTDAGSYETELYISGDDTRYKASVHAELTINKGSNSQFELVNNAMQDVTWNSGLKLKDISLTDCYKWQLEETHIDDIGEQTFKVVYTPTDTNNYMTETNDVTINVIKANANITTNESYEFTYNPNGYELLNIQPSHDESKLQYAYECATRSVDGINNVGDYKVTITLPESTHYNKAEKVIDVKVTQVVNTDAIVKKYTNIVYGQTLQEFSLPASTNLGSWSWAEDITTLVGNANNTTTHTAVYSANDKVNYADRSVDVEFEVVKQVVNKPTVLPKTYTGEPLTANITIVDDTKYAVTQNNGGIDVGTYDVVLTLNDANNYCWPDSDLADTTLDFEILSNDSNMWISEGKVDSFVYGQNRVNIVYPEPKFIDEGAVVEAHIYRVENGVVSDRRTDLPRTVGTYRVYFFLPASENGNYNAIGTDDRSQLDVTKNYLQFSINPVQVALPTVEDLTYNGKEQNAEVPNHDGYTVVDNPKNTNVGEYTVTLGLSSGIYVWEDGTTANKSITYKINKYENNGWAVIPRISSWTYTPLGGVEGEATPEFGTPIIEYKGEGQDDSLYTTTLPKNAGSYVARFKVDDTNNYNGITASTIKFVISKATPVVTAPTYNMSVGYYENTVDVTACYVTAPSVANEVSTEGGNTFVFGKPILVTTNNVEYEQVAFEVEYVSASANYTNAKVTAYINLYKVAQVGTTYYGSIENAIANTESGTITVLPNATGNVTIASNVTIKAGVTLQFPYQNLKTGAVEVNKSGKATLHSYFNKNNGETEPENYGHDIYFLQLTSKVVVKQGVIVTNYGTITIAGELTAGSQASADTVKHPGIKQRCTMVGHTARYYAKVVLESNAQIISGTGSNINCYGFIDESSKNNNSKVTIKKDAKLYMPIIIHDTRGGTYMKTVYSDDRKISPFNQWEFRNIVSTLRVEFGGELVSTANLYASSMINHSDVKIIGDSNTYLIELKEGSYLEAKYDIDETTRPANTDKWEYGIVKVSVYGDTNVNYLTLTIAALASVSTKDSTLPVCDRLHISLYDGNFSILNKAKLLPGSMLYVDSSATLTAAELTVYEVFEDNCKVNKNGPISVSNYGHYRDLAPAKLIVNGKLTATSLGGKVITTQDDAIVEITNASCLCYEATELGTEKVTIGWGWLSTTIDKDVVKQVQSTGASLQLVYMQDDTVLNTVTAENNKTYTSGSNTWA